VKFNFCSSCSKNIIRNKTILRLDEHIDTEQDKSLGIGKGGIYGAFPAAFFENNFGWLIYSCRFAFQFGRGVTLKELDCSVKVLY
jgi:hypothetical protein